MSKVVPTVDPRFSDPAILAFPRSPCRTKPTRKKGQSVYDKYQLPFFDKKRLLLWAVEPTGSRGGLQEGGGIRDRTFEVE
jgi:hypothetical protein